MKGWSRALVFGAMLACDEPGARITAKVGSDFAPAGRSISILGVYKDGQMSVAGWEALAPHVLRAFGGADCPVGYSVLAATDGVLADAIDAYAQANGPTDGLLSQIAPAARGDAVLVFTFAGKLPGRVDGGPVAPAPNVGARGPGRMGGRTGPRAIGGGSPPMPRTARDSNVLDIAASLYSVAAAKSVALVSMQYDGSSLEEAMDQFAAKLAETFPRASCAGWNFEGTVDAKRIRESADE